MFFFYMIETMLFFMSLGWIYHLTRYKNILFVIITIKIEAAKKK